MKLNLEIDIDWIDSEQTIDEVVKQEIISAIIAKIDEKIYSGIEKKVNSKIDETVVTKINELTEKMFEDFTSREVAISDNYGSTIKVYENLSALVKERFDRFMIESVDEKGKTSDSSYGRKQKRIDFIVDMRLKDFADKFTKDAVEKVSKEIKSHVESGLKQHMGEKLLHLLDLPKLLEGKR